MLVPPFQPGQPLFASDLNELARLVAMALAQSGNVGALLGPGEIGGPSADGTGQRVDTTIGPALRGGRWSFGSITAVTIAGGAVPPVLPSLVTYSAFDFERNLTATGSVPISRPVNADEMAIWPAAVGDPCLFLRLPAAGAGSGNPGAEQELLIVFTERISATPCAERPAVEVVDGGDALVSPTGILVRRDTAADWATAEPVLRLGEIGLETDTGRFKIGDGAAEWTVLAYADEAFAIAWSQLTGVPTTLAGHGITNAIAADPASTQTIVSGGTSVVPLALRAAAGQTADVLRGVNSDGTASWYFDSGGVLWVRGTAAAPPAVYMFPYTGSATFGFWNSSGSSVAEFSFDTVGNVFSMSSAGDVNILTSVQALRVTSVGAVIVGNATTNTGAWLLIRAGTTTRASVNIPTGTLKTTPAVGDLEHSGGWMSWTGVAGQRGTLPIIGEQTANIAANTNNLALNRSASLLRLNCTAAVNLTGLTDGRAGRGVDLVNVGTATVTLTANDANSTAANQFAVAITLAAGATARVVYDGTSLRWRRIQ